MIRHRRLRALTEERDQLLAWQKRTIKTLFEAGKAADEQMRELERSERERIRLQDLFDRATQPLTLDQYREYITSANAIPVTRCQVSAEHLRQLIERCAQAERHRDALREQLAELREEDK